MNKNLLNNRFLVLIRLLVIALGSVFLNHHAMAQRGVAIKDKSEFSIISWNDLVPKSWSPRAIMKDFDLNALQDGDPRANEAMAKMRAAWDNAPANPLLSGKKIKIAGFVVPLEAQGIGKMKEFLLVPYFGACIHTPPPPANQIIQVQGSRSFAINSMDAVWVEGTIQVWKTQTGMGAAGYRLIAQNVTPYQQ